MIGHYYRLIMHYDDDTNYADCWRRIYLYRLTNTGMLLLLPTASQCPIQVDAI